MDLKREIYSLSREICFLEAEILRLEGERNLLGKREKFEGELSRLQWMQDLYELNEAIKKLEEMKEGLRKKRFELIREFISRIERKMKEGGTR